MPFRQRLERVDCANQNRDVFGIEWMAVDVAAVRGPQIVIMGLNKETKRTRSTDKNLTVYCSVLAFDGRTQDPRNKFGRQLIAVGSTEVPGRPELFQNGLLEVIR